MVDKACCWTMHGMKTYTCGACARRRRSTGPLPSTTFEQNGEAETPSPSEMIARFQAILAEEKARRERNVITRAYRCETRRGWAD